jgi:alkylation response protein AidB-like acyl-CoA dehydrogenase
MTERPGGSDVSLTETVAVACDPGKTPENGDAFLIDGFKWFSSATDADVTLALARTGTVESGARGLSLFAIKMRQNDGQLNGIQIHRLKKKWGTKVSLKAVSECDSDYWSRRYLQRSCHLKELLDISLETSTKA